MPVTPPSVPPPQPAETPPAKPVYLWDTVDNARHSLRVICDEEGLTVAQKNTLCATVACESGFHTNAINYNRDANGKVVSTDYGICQWNDYYHGLEITPDEALHNPEKAVRLMCKYWKEGQQTQWVCYSSGKFSRFL